MKYANSLVGIVILIMVGFSGHLFAADDDFFNQQEIDVNGTILGSREGDFNGDGRTDLAFFINEDFGQRSILVFIQRESGRFPPGPSQKILLSASVNMAQCADLNTDGKTEIHIIDSEGMWVFEYDSNGFRDQPRHTAQVATVFIGGIKNRILSHEFIYSLPDKNIALMPVMDGYEVWTYSGNKFSRSSRLDFSHDIQAAESSIKLFVSSPVVYSFTFPKIYSGDSNGDSRYDIYLLWPDRLQIFTQGSNGEFDNQVSTQYRFRELTHDNICQAAMADVNNDGYLDLISCQSKGGLSEAETEVSLYDASLLRSGNVNPTQSISLTDICGNLIIDNFDNRIGLELVIPAIELGIMSTVKKMISNKTDLHLLIYPIDNLGRLPDDPEVRRKITCRLDFDRANPVGGFRLDWSADFTGDGLPDLITADGGSQLLFYSGSTEEYLEGRAFLVIDITDPDILKPVRLNNDNRADLMIIHYPNGGINRVTLFITNSVG
ncbi:MAG: VCBS repeat-containing protein [candidate division Zixibacteria bacterium]